MKDRAWLFVTGYVQVLLVALNTWQLSHNKLLGAAIGGFLISYIWSWNVKKVAFGSHTDRVIYSIGAAFGTMSGLLVATVLYEH